MTTQPTANDEFSYLLTESLLTRKTSSTLSLAHQKSGGALFHQQSIPTIVTSPPPSAMVIQEKNSNASFNQYLGNQYREDANVFLERLNSQHRGKKRPHRSTDPNTFWSYLSKDLDRSRAMRQGEEEQYNQYEDCDSIFSEKYIASSPSFFSTGAFLFLFGFICPPCWWIGSFYPKNMKKETRFIDDDMKMKLRWRLLNRFLSLGFSVLLIITIIVLAIIYSKIE